jgi:hypothetical protein
VGYHLSPLTGLAGVLSSFAYVELTLSNDCDRGDLHAEKELTAAETQSHAAEGRREE